MRFADILAPVDAAAFRANQFGRAPLHIPAQPGVDRRVLDWAGLNALLGARSHWTNRNLQLVFNGRPVLAEHYCEPAPSGSAPMRAAPAKVEVFTSMGASLIANAVHELSPAIRAFGDILAEQFMGAVEANLYCSFQNVQAFGPHYDLHEVFAVQCEGEKTWRLYSGRADAPLDPPPFTDEARLQMEAAKGDLIAEVRMRPGDLLYIPRGFYHDALASSDASLHVTFSVTPHSGRALFALLEREALKDPAFRAYLADHRLAEGAVLRDQLADLKDRLSALMASPAFATEVALEQRKRRDPPFTFDLPRASALTTLQATGLAAEIRHDRDGAVLLVPGGRLPLGPHREAVEWLMTRPAFTVQELCARYRHFSTEELTALVGVLVRMGLFSATR